MSGAVSACCTNVLPRGAHDDGHRSWRVLPRGGRAALSRVIASGATAVIAYNDLMAIGLLKAAQDVDVAVPAAFSIIGFDDIFGADLTTPALTTVRTPLAQMGELAVRATLDPVEFRAHRSEVALDTELVIRRSTGPARG